MIEGFDHVGTDHKCSVCQCDFTDDEGGIQGYIGILPVAFCPTCYSGICDMVEQLDGREWEGLTKEDKNEILVDAVRHNWNDLVIVEQIEAKLKEKNSYE
jgi:hypothetical protein